MRPYCEDFRERNVHPRSPPRGWTMQRCWRTRALPCAFA